MGNNMGKSNLTSHVIGLKLATGPGVTLGSPLKTSSSAQVSLGKEKRG